MSCSFCGSISLIADELQTSPQFLTLLKLFKASARVQIAKPRNNIMKDMEEKWELFLTAVLKVSPSNLAPIPQKSQEINIRSNYISIE